MSAFRLRDCFRPLDYFLLGTLAGGLPIAFELGIEVSADAGILASLCLLAALLIVAWRAGREAERLAYGAPDRSLPPRAAALGLYRRERLARGFYQRAAVRDHRRGRGDASCELHRLDGRPVPYCRRAPLPRAIDFSSSSPISAKSFAVAAAHRACPFDICRSARRSVMA